MPRRFIVMLIASFMVAVGFGAGSAAAAGTTGSLALAVTLPDDATALIQIDRVDKIMPSVNVVHSADEEPAETVLLQPGTYRVTPRAVMSGGTRFVAAANPRQVRIIAGQTKTVDVDYVVSAGAQNLVPTALTSTSVGLDWDATAGGGTQVWRVTGDTPTSNPGTGTKVTLNGSSLIDTGLAPGTTYSYSIFSRPGDGKFGILDGDPVTITVGTLPDGDGAEPGFISAPGTTIFAVADIAEVRKTGTGVLLTLVPGVVAPVPGSVVSLPVTAVLEGGYLGEVVDVSSDGRTVLLTQASLAQAFDFYHLSVSQFTDAEPAVANGQASPLESAEAAAKTKRRSGGNETPGRPQTVAEAEQLQGSAKTATPTFAPMAAAANAPIECTGLSSGSVTPSFSTSNAGHAEVTVDKYKIWFVEVPSGVGVDFGYSVTAKGTVDVNLQAGVECGFPLPKFAKQLTLDPVPIAVMAEPVGEVAVTAGVTVSNFGMTTTAGFEASGHMGVTGGNYASGSPVLAATPTEPKATGEATVALSVSGNVNFGPGVGTSQVGVVAGLGGEVSLIDASLSAMVNAAGDSCLKLAAQSGFGIYLTARAWVPTFEWDYRLEIEALQKKYPWGGSPWYWPNDCEKATTPTDDVVGPGVTPISDDLIGSQEQWGKVDGFVPGEKTWVLSTGRVADAVGTPSFFASTDMSQPGLQSLSDLIGGAQTYDAAQLTVKVIPNEDTLHVRYAFASEEYPEYVGSAYNDVMAVFVDGQNCATVPGTTDPVSINSVNHQTNSQYYVDNSAGASGYGTSMDGLTVPLTCSVAVTPGQPVTVSIAVADASDAAYDSAIALLDGGIWSD